MLKRGRIPVEMMSKRAKQIFVGYLIQVVFSSQALIPKLFGGAK
jgi:hypothetical protein